jgi:hypothetical protein
MSCELQIINRDVLWNVSTKIGKGRGQEAGGRRQEAEGRGQKAKGNSGKGNKQSTI